MLVYYFGGFKERILQIYNFQQLYLNVLYCLNEILRFSFMLSFHSLWFCLLSFLLFIQLYYFVPVSGSNKQCNICHFSLYLRFIILSQSLVVINNATAVTFHQYFVQVYFNNHLFAKIKYKTRIPFKSVKPREFLKSYLIVNKTCTIQSHWGVGWNRYILYILCISIDIDTSFFLNHYESFYYYYLGLFVYNLFTAEFFNNSKA